MTKTTKTKKPSTPCTPLLPTYPKVIETYSVPHWTLRQLESSAPSVGNGNVQIRRYRITIELIDEPVEVLRDRLRTLWRESEANYHYRDPMRAIAVQLGMNPDEDLRSIDQGVDHKKRLQP